jgi:hypothetical protein
VFARGVDLNIALGGTFETMIIFIFEETHGAYKYFRTKNGSHICKEEKSDMSEAFIEEALQGCTRKETVPNSCSFQIRNDPYSTALQN